MNGVIAIIGFFFLTGLVLVGVHYLGDDSAAKAQRAATCLAAGFTQPQCVFLASIADKASDDNSTAPFVGLTAKR